MSPRFFIFALPRSGTAWLSMFLTASDSFCYHEPTADCIAGDWVRRAALRPESIVGGCDTGAYLYAPMVLDALPQASLFELHREPSDIENSLHAMGVAGYNPFKHQKMLREALKGVKRRIIEYPRLSDLQYLRDVWAMVIGTSFDEERAQMFLEMNIQRDMQKFLAARPRLQAMARAH